MTTRSTPGTVRRLLAVLLAVLGLLLLGAATAPAAFACPPEGCGHLPGDDDPPPTTPQPPPPRYELVVDKLQILDLQDTDGWDEPILKMDGETKIKNIAYQVGVNNLYAPMVKPSFTSYVMIEVREHNTNWWDDEIGWVTFHKPDPPLAVGASTVVWKDVWGAGAHYRLRGVYTRL